MDGSLAIAFLWNGEIRVSTRRRMDSEQAVWAQSWLRDRPGLAAELQQGWTYLFEVVWQESAQVVPYSFDGLVLLGVVSPGGQEVLSWRQRADLAMRMGVPVAPQVTGYAKDLLPRLSNNPMQRGARDVMRGGRGGPAVPQTPTVPPCSEGWVLIHDDGTRQKIILPAFKACHQAAKKLHPRLIWEKVRTGWPRAAILAGLPPHLAGEASRILSALEASYCDKRTQLLDSMPCLACGSTSPEQSCPPACVVSVIGLLDKLGRPDGMDPDHFPTAELLLDITAAAPSATTDDVMFGSPTYQPADEGSCSVCGCSGRVDAFGDRICFCDSCPDGCTNDVMFGSPTYQPADEGSCSVCGCSGRVDAFGDRICFCDSCPDGCTNDGGSSFALMPLHEQLSRRLSLVCEQEAATAGTSTRGMVNRAAMQDIVPGSPFYNSAVHAVACKTMGPVLGPGGTGAAPGACCWSGWLLGLTEPCQATHHPKASSSPGPRAGASLELCTLRPSSPWPAASWRRISSTD